MVDQDTNSLARQKRILEFLETPLAHKSKTERKQIAEALIRAGRKYDDYVSPKQLPKLKERRDSLISAKKRSEKLVEILLNFSMFEKDDLERRLGHERLEVTIGHLRSLRHNVIELPKGIKTTRGRPRNEAKFRWIREVAEIYENYSGKKASVWGSDSKTGKGKGAGRGPYYDLLEASLPDGFLRHDSLSPDTVRKHLSPDTVRRYLKDR